MRVKLFHDELVWVFDGNDRRINLVIRESQVIPNSNAILKFAKKNTKDVDHPYNDALVLKVKLSDYKVTKELVDTGSSVNVIYNDAIDRMGLPDICIKKANEPLTAFNCSITDAVGIVRLPTYVVELL